MIQVTVTFGYGCCRSFRAKVAHPSGGEKLDSGRFRFEFRRADAADLIQKIHGSRRGACIVELIFYSRSRKAFVVRTNYQKNIEQNEKYVEQSQHFVIHCLIALDVALTLTDGKAIDADD